MSAQLAIGPRGTCGCGLRARTLAACTSGASARTPPVAGATPAAAGTRCAGITVASTARTDAPDAASRWKSAARFDRLFATAAGVAAIAVMIGAACLSFVPRDESPAVPNVGTFSGRYSDGVPVYVFPPVRVVGHRLAAEGVAANR